MPGTTEYTKRFLNTAQGGLRLAAALLLAVTLSACGTNPVTGKRELQLVSESQEIGIGTGQYLFAQQSQGGEYSIDPELSAYVSEVGQRLVRVSDRPSLPYEFVVLNNSVPNAWALPGGKIAVNRALLLEMNSEAELAAVLGHEIVHAAARHGAKGMERGMMMQLGVAAIGTATASGKYSEYGNLIVGAASLGAQLISSRYGRGAELESDQYGMEYMAKAGYDLDGAVKLQETFLRLSEGREAGWLQGLFASHPPSAERVAKNREHAARLGTAGTSGVERYQAGIAGLKRNKKAYDLYAEGQKALVGKSYDRAWTLAGQAARVEPREALFYSLMGEARAYQNQIPEALRHFDQAIARNDRFFDYYLKRGIVRQQLGQSSAAAQDFNQSLSLLPTGRAHFGLAEIAQAANDVNKAITHYGEAANPKTRLGKEAMSRLVRLELPGKPGKYLKVAGVGNRNGQLAVKMLNQTPFPVSNVQALVTVSDANGRILARDRLEYSGRIEAGKSAVLATRIQAIPEAQAKDMRIAVEVVNAGVVE